MIKICYVIGQLGKGGAEKQLYELLKGIDRNKFYSTVICFSNGDYWAGEIKRLGIELVEFDSNKDRGITRLLKLIRILKEIKPTIVHTYLFSANTYGRMAAIITRTPIIVASERNLPLIGKDKNLLLICIDRFLAIFSNAITCNSHKAVDALTKKYLFNSKKVSTVHNGINIGNICLKERKKRDKIIIGTIGSLCRRKNHKLFLDMAKVILDKLERNVIFWIVGEGPIRNELERYARKLEIDGDVLFLGARNNIPELLQEMDVFVLTSLYEGMSNALMEAMACGLPCVVTNVGGNSELVEDGKTGYVVASGDSEAMVKKVSYLLKNEALTRRMGEQGRKRIEKYFSVDKMIKQTEGLYENLLAC